MPSKTKAPINFTIKRSPRTKQFRCVILNEGNHEITLTGEPCKNRADVHRMIAAHINAILTGNYIMPDTLQGSRELAQRLTKKLAEKPLDRSREKINRNWP